MTKNITKTPCKWHAPIWKQALFINVKGQKNLKLKTCLLSHLRMDMNKKISERDMRPSLGFV